MDHRPVTHASTNTGDTGRHQPTAKPCGAPSIPHRQQAWNHTRFARAAHPPAPYRAPVAASPSIAPQRSRPAKALLAERAIAPSRTARPLIVPARPAQGPHGSKHAPVMPGTAHVARYTPTARTCPSGPPAKAISL